MTLLATTLEPGVLYPVPSSTGVSSAADELEGLITQAAGALGESLAVGGTAEAGMAQLRRLQSSASEPNWDGYGAQAVNPRAVDEAIAFLRVLPTTVPVPDIAADPDGEVDLMWHVEPRRTLSVSVAPTGKLTYAALIGETQTYGTEWLAGGIPHTILYALGRLLGARR